MLIVIAKYQIFLEQKLNWQRSKGAPTCYYLNGALGYESNESQPVKDDELSDLCPKAWESSPEDVESVFNTFYFDKTVNSLNLAAFQASTKQLDIVSIPLDDESAIEPKSSS